MATEVESGDLVQAAGHAVRGRWSKFARGWRCSNTVTGTGCRVERRR